jgi:hypothetical protein
MTEKMWVFTESKFRDIFSLVPISQDPFDTILPTIYHHCHILDDIIWDQNITQGYFLSFLNEFWHCQNHLLFYQILFRRRKLSYFQKSNTFNILQGNHEPNNLGKMPVNELEEFLNFSTWLIFFYQVSFII